LAQSEEGGKDDPFSCIFSCFGGKKLFSSYCRTNDKGATTLPLVSLTNTSGHFLTICENHHRTSNSTPTNNQIETGFLPIKFLPALAPPPIIQHWIHEPKSKPRLAATSLMLAEEQRKVEVLDKEVQQSNTLENKLNEERIHPIVAVS